MMLHNNRHVVKLPLWDTLRPVLLSVTVVLLTVGVFLLVQTAWNVDTVLEWVLLAVLCALVSAAGAVTAAFCTDAATVRKWTKKIWRLLGR